MVGQLSSVFVVMSFVDRRCVYLQLSWYHTRNLPLARNVYLSGHRARRPWADSVRYVVICCKLRSVVKYSRDCILKFFQISVLITVGQVVSLRKMTSVEIVPSISSISSFKRECIRHIIICMFTVAYLSFFAYRIWTCKPFWIVITRIDDSCTVQGRNVKGCAIFLVVVRQCNIRSTMIQLSSSTDLLIVDGFRWVARCPATSNIAIMACIAALGVCKSILASTTRRILTCYA